MLSQSVLTRLGHQLDAVATILTDAPERTITTPATEGAWSAHHHFAHIARMHEVLLERLRWILRDEEPRLPEYRAEADPEWPRWAALPTRELLTRLQALRSELRDVVRGLSDAELERRGIDPTLGPLPVSGWIEAFCLHEGHHLHEAWRGLAEARRRVAGGPPAG